MKLFRFVVIGLFAFKVNYTQAEPFKFTELKTGHLLSIEQGFEFDFNYAKTFCKFFFERTYNQIPQEKREFKSVSELVEQKFSDHRSRIFEQKKYTFFVVKHNERFVGYTIFDTIGDVVYSIETQVDIETYDIKNLMTGLAQFIKKRLAPNAQLFIASARISVPVYGQLLMSCGFEPCDNLHPSLAKPADYYDDASRASVAQFYQAYSFNLSNSDNNDSDADDDSLEIYL